MEALRVYASESESSESEDEGEAPVKRPRISNGSPSSEKNEEQEEEEEVKEPKHSKGLLPPPPPDLLNPLNSVMTRSTDIHGGRSRSFPHVEGNYALHVYIPVPMSSIAKRQLEPLFKKASLIAPELQSMEFDESLCASLVLKDKSVSAHVLTVAKEYHISLSRTVPIRVHQIDSIVHMLRHKFHNQKRYWVDFSKWDIFVNDERARTFLALEVNNPGSSQICKQVHSVNDVFRLHNLPTFYQNPRPHISVAWALGDLYACMRIAAEELNKLNESGTKGPIYSHLSSKVECKIGSQTYLIWQAKTSVDSSN